MARSSRHGVNITRLSEELGISRGAIYRAFAGRASLKTARVLQEAGIVTAPSAGLIIPPNLRTFALHDDVSYRDVERLVNLRLKPVERMTPEELRYISSGLKDFPGLYDWVPPRSELK